MPSQDEKVAAGGDSGRSTPSAAGSVGTDADVDGAAAGHLTGDEGDDRSDQEAEGGDDYWDEEDELANDFQRERAGSEGGNDTPAPSGRRHVGLLCTLLSNHAVCTQALGITKAISVMRPIRCCDAHTLDDFAQGRWARMKARRRGLRTAVPAALHI